MVGGLVLAEDGRKLSKSLNNFPDTMAIVKKFGADALRYFLLASPLVHADEVSFSEKALTEIQNKLFNKLTNVMSFLDMYGVKDRDIDHEAVSQNILDMWIQVELDTLVRDMTEALDGYQIDKALRPLLQFVEELSTWYLRRSRDRFKDEKDALAVTGKLIQVLTTLSKLMAPATPFMAEEIYQFVKKFDAAGTYVESVHLESWPIVSSSMSTSEADEIISKMQKTREVVEHVLGLRNKANIKVRQPLALLSLPSETYAGVHTHILQDELNIKSIDVSPSGATLLDTVVTEELRIEGLARDVVREIQSKRKDLNLVPADFVSVTIHTDTLAKGDYEKVAELHMKMFTDIANVTTLKVLVTDIIYSLEVVKV
jgi:isoleucyl-tRNA synthetase